jgi:hypothetical protein
MALNSDHRFHAEFTSGAGIYETQEQMAVLYVEDSIFPGAFINLFVIVRD